ncbi:MAG: hypothetical protein ACJ8M1_14015 [Chthoniobacterales bacterium]
MSLLQTHQRIAAVFVTGACLLLTSLSGLTGCAFIAHHSFAQPSTDWQSRTGQLQYRTGGVSVMGDVLVRFSKAGDFELTFSKGPGVNLFVIRQDANFAQVRSSLTRLTWSGPPASAPKQLRGWLSLREKLLANPDRRVIRHTADGESFVFRF